MVRTVFKSDWFLIFSAQLGRFSSLHQGFQCLNFDLSTRGSVAIVTPIGGIFVPISSLSSSLDGLSLRYTRFSLGIKTSCLRGGALELSAPCMAFFVLSLRVLTPIGSCSLPILRKSAFLNSISRGKAVFGRCYFLNFVPNGFVTSAGSCSLAAFPSSI